MTILLEHYFDHHSAVEMDAYACDYLAETAVAAECRMSVRGGDFDVAAYSMLVSRGALPQEFRHRTVCFGGRSLSRVESFDYVGRAGLSEMEWATAATLADVEALFGGWQTDRLILKRSGSHKGLGVSMVSQPDLENLKWDPEGDVFCKEVNREDGTVTKIECLAGRPVFKWSWRQPPIRAIFAGGELDRKAYLSGLRMPDVELPEDLLARTSYCSELATDDGLGHISLDFMRGPDGRWRVIEMNTQEVAVWWTSKFETARRNYARALHSLVKRI